MLNSLKSKLALLVRTKVGLAVVAALLLGGGGTALAATTVPGFGQPLGSALESALGGSGDHAGNTSNGDHSGDSGESTGAGDGGGEPTATSSDVSYSTQGTVASIGASSFVVQHGDGQTIVDVDGSTQWKGVSGLGALTTGMTVSAKGTERGDGSMSATMVEVSSGSGTGDGGGGGGGGGGGEPTATPNPAATTQGTVASIGEGSFVVQHGDGQTTVDVNGSTQWKGVSGLGALTTGMTVSVSGTSQEGGAILATMVEVTTSGDPTATPTSTGK